MAHEDDRRRADAERRRQEAERRAYEEERQRQQAERAALPPHDLLYDREKRVTAYGGEDGRSKRRTYRKFPFFVRMQPRIYAIVEAIQRRDNINQVVLLEAFVQAYLKVHGDIPAHELPSDEEIIARYMKEQDKRHGE